MSEKFGTVRKIILSGMLCNSTKAVWHCLAVLNYVGGRGFRCEVIGAKSARCSSGGRRRGTSKDRRGQQTMEAGSGRNNR